MAPNSTPPPHVGIVGGGIVGLATARALLLRDGGCDVTVLEKEPRLATHQTTRNSGVLHAGIYYEPGSLKARLCRRGAELMAAYCEEHGLPYERRGKVIVALDEAELPRMDDLLARGRANGVPGLRRVESAELVELEPHAAGVAALHSPSTAVVDFAAVARRIAGEVAELGGAIRTAAAVSAIEPRATGLRVRAGEDTLDLDYLVSCAGAQADRIAALAGQRGGPRIVPFKGRYLQLRPDRRELVRSMIYPVPDPRYPFLGVHLTRGVADDVLVGPNAFLALAREADASPREVLADLAATLRWPGFWRLVPEHVRAAADELTQTVRRRAYTRMAQRYVPALDVDDTVRGPYGIRAQAVHPDGRLEDDFLVSADDAVLHVRNAPSPAATSSLALGEHIAAAVPTRRGEPLRAIETGGG